MMMMNKNKRLITVISGKLKDGKSVNEPSGEENVEYNSDMAMKSACEDMIRALDAKDASLLKQSLTAFMQLLMDQEHEQREQENEVEED